MIIKKNAIFVSIASYRDELCSKTIESLYSNAKYPGNIFIGICQQNTDEDAECFDLNSELIKKYENNIRLIRLKNWEAKGPTYARYLCSTLWNGEEYFFQIDSHSILLKDWDEKAVNMIHEIKNTTKSKNVILSHYPKELEAANNDNKGNEVPRICKSFFNDRGMISFLGAEAISISKHTYVETPYIAGGMLFSESKLLRDVPFDPNLDFLFVGEEISHSIRCWTAGYDIYTPSENLVFHFYTREEAPKIWTDKTYSDEDAFNKIKMLIKLSEDNIELPNYIQNNIEKYGLGTVRTLEDYYNFAGIDIKNKVVNKDFCKQEIIEKFSDSCSLSSPYKNILFFTIFVFYTVIILLLFLNK